MAQDRLIFHLCRRRQLTRQWHCDDEVEHAFPNRQSADQQPAGRLLCLSSRGRSRGRLRASTAPEFIISGSSTQSQFQNFDIHLDTKCYSFSTARPELTALFYCQRCYRCACSPSDRPQDRKRCLHRARRCGRRHPTARRLLQCEGATSPSARTATTRTALPYPCCSDRYFECHGVTRSRCTSPARSNCPSSSSGGALDGDRSSRSWCT